MTTEDRLIEEVEQAIDAEDDAVRSKVSTEASGNLGFEMSTDGRYAKLSIEPCYAHRSTLLLEAYKDGQRIARVVRPDELRIYSTNLDITDLLNKLINEIKN
jgi:hypothetical protein